MSPEPPLIAPDREAYGNLCQFITDLRCASPKGRYHLPWRAVQPRWLAGLLVIALPSRRASDAELLGLGRWLLEHFMGRAWIGADLGDELDDPRWKQRLRWLAEQTALPVVAAPRVRMHRTARKPLLDALTATRLHRALEGCGQDLEASASAALQPLDSARYPEATSG